MKRARTHRWLLLIYGRPLTLKSTLAVHLSWHLHAPLVSTAFFGSTLPYGGSVAFRRSRSVRYTACDAAAEHYASRDWNVVVEGTFSRQEWRAPILDVARRFDLSLIAVRCTCANRSELLRRQAARQTSQFAPDRNVAPYAGKGVPARRLGSAETHSFDRFSSFEVDTGLWKLNVVKASPDSRFLERILRSWIRINARAPRGAS